MVRLRVEGLREQEVQLHSEKANNFLHEIWLALANKVVLFQMEVQYASGHVKTTQTWSKVNALDAILGRHIVIYRRCRKAIINLRADETTIGRYQMLRDKDLKTVDIARETETNDWMLEFYQVNWFCAKAKRNRWTKEEEFLRNEFEWTVNFFHSKVEVWEHHSVVSQNKGLYGPACYTTRQ
ncbi:hypothetical protein HD554DRAFT_2040399 [Boletus coccyginus]|nr:hypothetical protein HD554DRAFT_2040399 [Boletus coccyginus]